MYGAPGKSKGRLEIEVSCKSLDSFNVNDLVIKDVQHFVQFSEGFEVV